MKELDRGMGFAEKIHMHELLNQETNREIQERASRSPGYEDVKS